MPKSKETLAAPASFEQAYQELAQIVSQLETGNLTLDESIALFERGQQLSNWCEDQLNKAELRISQVDGQESDASAEQDG